MAPTTTAKKTTKAKATKILVALVLDETGSMGHIAEETRSSVNSYFEELKKETPDALVALMEFSQTHSEPTFRTLCSGVKVAKVPQLTPENYRPRGFTPLYDAIGKSLVETSEVEADRYLLVIVTDGQENASEEYTGEQVRQMIAHREGTGKWTVVFLAANIDAFATGAALGVGAGNTMSYAATGQGVHNTTSSLAKATGMRASSPQASTGTFFADAGQDASDYDDPSGSKLWTPKKK